MSSEPVFLDHPTLGAHLPFERGPRTSWRRLLAEDPETARQIVIEGRLIAEGEDLDPSVAKRVKARLLGTFSGLPAPGTSPGTGRGRWLIPGLWRWGHIPMLGGNPKAGKSTLVADLVASLVIPGRPFLQAFEPAELANHERERGLWLINAENPADELAGALGSVGLEFYDSDRFASELSGDVDSWLLVEHLEVSGGAQRMDLRNPDLYELWLSRISDYSCQVCDGQDEKPPLAVIVDGLTAILGSDTSAYGEWYAQFRRLMRELDVPNALVVAHNGLRGMHLMNGVESMAQADGLWNYWSEPADDPNGRRYFSAQPRLMRSAIPRTRVHMDDAGQLRLDRAASPPDNRPEPREVEDEDNTEVDVRRALLEAGVGGLMTVEITGRGKEGQSRRAALHRLVDGGEVFSRPDGKGKRWFLAVNAP